MELLLLDSCVIEEGVRCLSLLSHHLHHHLHLVLLVVRVSHGGLILHHFFHLLHLDVLLLLEGRDCLGSSQPLFGLFNWHGGLLLHLHDHHALSLILSVEHSCFLEVFILNSEFVLNG